MLIDSALATAIRNQSQVTEYLTNDDFTTALAAGALDGRSAEPGPGQRLVIDGNSKMSISGEQLVIATGGVGQGNPQLLYNPVMRAGGRLVVAQVVPTTETFAVGFDSETASVVTAGGATSGVRFAGSSRTLQVYVAGIAISVGAWVAATTYQIAVVARIQGAHYLIKGGIFTNWTLLWASETGGNAAMPNLYPAIVSDAAGAVFVVGYIRVPSARWLPTPLVSDGFLSWGISDGLGHAEGLAGGLGNGGNGKTWDGIGWSVAAGKASNTPTKGSQLLTDGALDTWASSTNLTNWIETIAGTSTVTQETSDVRTGSAAKLTVDSSNSVAKIAQTIANANGDLLLVSLWAKTSVAGRSISIDENSGGITGQIITLTTAYVQYPTLIKASKINTDIGVKRSTLTSAFALIEDVTVQVITLSTLRALTSLAKADVLVSIGATLATGALGGLMVSVDSTVTPANFALILLSSTLLQVFKVVAGVLSAVSATAITYAAGAALVVRKVGSEYRIFYNNAAVVTATIADTGIVSNTIHGIFSTDATNTFDDFIGYAVGSGGEHAALDAF